MSQTSKCLFACVPTEGAGDSDSKEHLSYLNMPRITEGISRIFDFLYFKSRIKYSGLSVQITARISFLLRTMEGKESCRMDFICMPVYLCSVGFNNAQVFMITVYVNPYVTVKLPINKDTFHKWLSSIKMFSTDDYMFQGESISI